MTQSIEETLQNQIKDLKSRILDTQDLLTHSQNSEKELATALTEIVNIIGLTSETGQVQLIDVVNAVKRLVDEVNHQKDTPLVESE